MALYTQHPALYHLQIKILLSQIWLLLCRQEGEAPEPMTPERERDEERLKRAMNYMHAHYGEHFSLEELARQALTSRSELCRCFRRMLGMPPKEFLMQYRIQQAEILLKNSAYSIADVAEFTGFSTKKSRCCEAARLAAKMMAAIQQSWAALLIDPFRA